MSEADQTAIRYVEESEFGVSPTGSLVEKTTVQVSGANSITSSAITVETADDSFAAASGLDIFNVNDIITVSGCTNSENNGSFVVLTTSATKITVDPPTPDLVDEASGASITISKNNAYVDETEDLSVFKANQLILVSGFTEAANNGYKHVVSATENELVVEETLADEEVGDTVTIYTAMKDLRFTSESLGQDTDTAESDEVRDDRQLVDVVRTSIRAGGDINFELSYNAFDDLLKAALCSADWSTEVEDTNTTHSMDDSDNSINDSGNGYITNGFAANQWVEIRGFSESANNGYFKIVSVAAGKMVLAGGTVVTEAAGDSVTITMGPQILNGVVGRSFSIERQYSDLTTTYALYTGMMVDTLSLDITAERIMTGTMGFMGKSETSEATSLSLGTAKAAPTKEVMTTVEDVEGVLENMTSVGITAFTLALANNLRGRVQVGTLGPISVGKGRIGVSGTLQMYFATATIMDKYLGFDSSSLSIKIEDTAGNVYIIDMPRVKYTSGRRVAGGANTDIIADMAFSAYRHATEDVTIRIAKFDA